MIDELEVTNPSRTGSRSVERLSQEGLIAGLLGALTIALWFLLLDLFRGRPLMTPSLLGTAIFHGGAGLETPARLPVSLEMVVLYTWVHALVFCVVGGLAARLLAFAERRPNAGFGILLLFVVFEFGFVLAAMIFAEPVLRVLTWPAVLFGNLLAAVVMGTYLWHRHPGLTVWP